MNRVFQLKTHKMEMLNVTCKKIATTKIDILKSSVLTRITIPSGTKMWLRGHGH